MKCESCQQSLEEYLDGELSEREASAIAAHVARCASCAAKCATFSGEQELFSRYDRDLAIPPLMWEHIAERTAAPVVSPVSENGFGARLVALSRVPSFAFSFAAATVLVVFALVIYAAYMKTQKPKPVVALPQPRKNRSLRKSLHRWLPVQRNLRNTSQLVIRTLYTAEYARLRQAR